MRGGMCGGTVIPAKAGTQCWVRRAEVQRGAKTMKILLTGGAGDLGQTLVPDCSTEAIYRSFWIFVLRRI